MTQCRVKPSRHHHTRRLARIIFAGVVLAITTVIQDNLTWADTNIWTSSSTGGWFSGANWTLGAVPTSLDDAFVTNATTAIVDGPTSGTASNLIIESGGVTVGSVATGSLTIVGEVAVGTLSTAGTLTLNTGTLSLNTLTVGVNGTYTDTVAGTLVLTGVNPTIQVSNGVGVVVNSTVTGSNGLTKDGLGILTLTGSNTYVGGTMINSGTLQVGNGGTSGSLGAGDVTNNSSLVFDHSDGITVSNNLTGAGSLTQAGIGTLTLAADNSYTGGTTISSGTLQVGTGGTTGSVGTGDITDNSALVYNRSDDITVSNNIAGTGSFTQAGTNTLVLLGTNTCSGSTLINSGTLQVGNGGTTGTLGTGIVSNNSELAFDRSDSIVVSNQITGTGNLTQAGTGTLILAGTNTYSGNTTINSGTLQVGDGGTTGTLGTGIVSNNSELAFDRSDSIVVSNQITGTGNLTQAGTGTLILAGTNTYSGGTTINSGTLQVGDGGTSGSLGAGDVTNNSSLVFDHSDGITVSNNITGTGSLTQAGTGTLTLAADNSYTGGTTISSGTLQVGTGGTTGSVGTGDITDNSALVYNRSDDITVSNNISGTGRFTQAGTNTLVLLGTNTYSGTTIISSGTLQVGNGGTTGSLGTGAVSNNSILVFNRSDDITVSNNIKGAGSLTQGGTDTLILAGTNTYSGGTIIDSGTLQVGNGGATGSLGTGVVSNNSALVFDRSDSIVVSNKITGTGNLAQAGTGTLILAGTNTYSGGTTINSGTLAVRNSHALGSGDLNLLGGVLQANTLTINVGGNFTQTVAGTLALAIGSTNSFGQLAAGGAASLDGTLHLVATNGYVPQHLDVFALVTASNGVMGTFSTVTNGIGHSVLLTPTLVYNTNDVMLSWAQSSFVPFALTRNQLAVAHTLDSIANSSNPQAVALINFLDYVSNPTNQLPTSFNLISPEQLIAMFSMSFASLDAQGDRFLQRANELRAGYRGLYVNAYNQYVASGGEPAVDPGPGKPKTDILSSVPANPWGVYVEGGGQFADVSGDSNAGGYSITVADFTAGLDRRINDHLVVGGAVTYAGGNAGLNNGGSISSDSYLGQVYAVWFKGGLHLEGMVGGGLDSYDTHRQGLQGMANGSTDGYEWDALLAGGYDWQKGSWSFGPQLTLKYLSANISSFDETGSLAPLHIDSQTEDALRTQLGVIARFRHYVKPTLTFITPEAYVAWQHDYLDNSFALTSRLLSGGNSFTVHGPSIGSDSIVLGGGITAQWNPVLSTYLHGTMQTGQSGYSEYGADGGIRIGF